MLYNFSYCLIGSIEDFINFLQLMYIEDFIDFLKLMYIEDFMTYPFSTIVTYFGGTYRF